MHRSPEYKIEIRINSKGVRSDKEIPYEHKDKNIKRIVLLGDSFGLGYGVNIEESFPEYMRIFLKQKNVNVEVVNLSVSGHGNAEELIMLENEGLKYKPDLVILQFHKGDYEDNVRSNLFTLKNGKLIKKNEEYLPAAKIREKLFRYGAYSWIASNSHTYTWVREEVAKKVKKSLATKNAEDKNDKDSAQTDHILHDSLTIAIIQRMKEICVENGAEFLVLDIPKKEDSYKYVPSYLTDFNNDLPDVHYVMPAKDMMKYGKRKLYWEKAHGHFTPLGTKIIGKTLATYIVESKLL